MAQVDLHRSDVVALLLLAQVLVDVQVGDFHARLHLALAQALQQQLVAQFLAEALLAHAVPRQAAVEVIDRHVVLAGHALFGLRHGVVIHLEARLLGLLQLCALQDDALQHLARQQLPGRHGTPLLGQLGFGAGQARADLVVGHGLGIDHGDNEIRLPGCRAAATTRRFCRQRDRWCGRRARRQPFARRCAGRAQPLGQGALGEQGSQGGNGQCNDTVIHGVKRRSVGR